MLIDEAEIEVSGGHGGAGKASFFKKGRGPDGGNGGDGGDLYFESTTDLTALNRYASKKKFAASDGEPGGSNRKSGHNALDLTLLAPIGTDLFDLETEELFSLDNPNTRVLICKGGAGGLGNADRANARMTTPTKAQPGLPGQKRRLKLTLKLIADFGLVGLPNAGKSSLLNALTNANAPVGDYPFTTLEPNLGAVNGKIIADIPGLIEGASRGKGLGDRFLKHIEKVPVILHCIAADSTNPLADYNTIRQELKQYNPELLNKQEIILMTKADLANNPAFKKLKKKITPVSILDDTSLERLKDLIQHQKFPTGP
ncbi:GTPase ObgE [Patescibacteria group bacterium]|nr:GTPase ObgE [Patescibacteria group bacterium]